MLSAIISSDYLAAMHIQKAFDYSNLKSLAYKTNFQIADHYDFLYHDGFFVFLKDPTEIHLNFCIHLSTIAPGRPMFVLLENCEINLLNSFKESLTCRVFLAPFSYKRIVSLYESHRESSMDNVQQYQKSDAAFELDSTTRHLILDGKTHIRLNNKEFYILKFLFANQEKIVSKIDLFEYVWGGNLLGSIATVDTHMSRLRKKIKRYLEHDPIKTIPCAGYMLK